MKRSFFLFIVLGAFRLFSQTGWMPVTGFGTNPGNLNMYSYVPVGISGASPLVVVMHGCTQNATIVSSESGWNTLADRHKFILVYPEQVSANNSSYCFNWFQSGDQDRNQGEVLSIKQMVDHMKANYTIDTNKIFVTGLSAGACMTTVMLACYPEIFKKGAVMAGAPFKSATNAAQAFNVGQGSVTNTPQNWGTLVTNEYPGYTGTYPSVAVFHGSSDNVISIVNENEIMKQWTGVHQADQTADVVVNSFSGNAFVTKNIYNDNNGNEIVETYTLSGMGHAIALDTGACYEKCGKTGNYALQVYLSSTFWAAYFFDILIPPYSITGSQNVIANQNGVAYSVANTGGSTYSWTVPPGATVASGQGTNQVTVNFGTQSGYVEVTEMQSGGCKNGPVKIFVTVGSNGLFSIEKDQTVLISDGRSVLIRSASNENYELEVTDAFGKKVFEIEVQTNKEIILDEIISPGFYFLQARSGKNQLNKKIIIQ